MNHILFKFNSVFCGRSCHQKYLKFYPFAGNDLETIFSFMQLFPLLTRFPMSINLSICPIISMTNNSTLKLPFPTPPDLHSLCVVKSF